MSKINVKNSSFNSFISFLKEEKIKFKVMSKSNNTEIIRISTKKGAQSSAAMESLRTYGINLYHDVTLHVDGKAQNMFNYFSNQYENMVEGNIEYELPNYYVENLNDQNTTYSSLKSLSVDVVTRKYIEKIAQSQKRLPLKTQAEQDVMKNVYFGETYRQDRSNANLNEFCYYNKIKVTSYGNNEFIGTLLKKLNMQEEIFEGLIELKNSIAVDFVLNNEDTVPVSTYDIAQNIKDASMIINFNNKLIFSEEKNNSNFMSNNFNKYLLRNYVDQAPRKFVKSFTQIYENEECEKEYLMYKIEKYRDTDTTPMQSFWMYEKEFKEYYDYQVKFDSSYRYSVKCYCVIYGTSTTVSDIKNNNGIIDFKITKSPSFRMVLLDFYEKTIRVTPKILPPPFVEFLNESNSNNSVKIYLDLKNTKTLEVPISITEDDALLLEDIETDAEGKIPFEYQVQDGKFEVFRTDIKPEFIEDFRDAKILDARNKHSSTSVVFKNKIFPNKKYYYMFRAVNSIGVASNPSPVYEVELLKDATNSMIKTRVVDLSKKQTFFDKRFKSLLQIKPAFDQEIFNDGSEEASNLSTYRKKINNLTLGTAIDKVWGKKFKIRVKSNDTGKIIDLNVKFNLVKDNIK